MGIRNNSTIKNLENGWLFRNLLFKDVFEYCRNMSTDAQQEIDEHGKNNEALAKVCSNLNDKIERLERERGSQKQKLQTFYDTLVVIAPKTVKIEEYDKKTKESWIVQTADPSEWTMFIDSLGEWLVKFKELLK